ncbi:hypothetical protein V5799_028121 [Amblyomma americanum]|uniref:ABC transporter domain-containing protein n=1 Tax=Amblyomma americanum TaxID=6943 RepID=A0AAQ4DDS2_AMBAM
MLTYEVPIFFMDAPGSIPYEDLSLDQGAHWSNLHIPGSPYDNVTLVGMLCAVLCYCLVYAALIWYLDNVWPWQYGIPKGPLFFTKPFSLFQIYPNKTVALRQVSLKAYPGDVTVLLGRNGAGKTTLLRLITGLEQASDGSVYVAGRNIALDTDAARRSMGFCPQENILFLSLTVLEHLQFFAKVRDWIYQVPGTGYWIRATIEQDVTCDEVVAVIRKHVPQAQVQEDAAKTLNANVGDIGACALIALLEELEEKWSGLLWLSVYVAALEDVLRQVERDKDRRRPTGDVDEQAESAYPLDLIEANFSAGDMRPSLTQRLAALVIKRLQYGRRDFRLPMLMVLLPLSERVRNVKLLQLLSGASPAAFWGTAFAVDLALHAVCSLLLLVPFVLLDWHRLYTDASTLGPVYALMMSYGCASIPLAYVVSLFCDQPSTGYVTIASISIVAGAKDTADRRCLHCECLRFPHAGMLLNVSMSLLYLLPALLEPMNNETRDTSGLDVALWVFRGIPSFSLAWGVSNCLQISQESVMCRYMSTFDRLLFCQNFGLEKIPDHLNRFIECCPEKCRDCILSKGCLTWDKMSAGRDLCLMLLVGAALLSLVTAVDSGWLRRLVHGACSSRRRDPAVGVGEHACLEERARVQELVAHGRCEKANEPGAAETAAPGTAPSDGSAVLCAVNLSKNYGSVQAVCGLSFALSKHECFGLLGMNGAGKTTTFRMLAGDLVPTAGNAYIGDADLVGSRRKGPCRASCRCASRAARFGGGTRGVPCCASTCRRSPGTGFSPAWKRCVPGASSPSTWSATSA